MLGAVQLGLLAACVVLFVPMGMAGWHLSRNKVLFFSGALFITLAVGVHLTPYFPSVSDFVTSVSSSSVNVVVDDRASCVSLLHEIVWEVRPRGFDFDPMNNNSVNYEKSWSWKRSDSVESCEFQRLNRHDVSVLLNGSWVVVAGDSQARIFALSLLSLVLDPEGMESVKGSLFKRHSDYHTEVDEMGMMLDFMWAPYVTNLTSLVAGFKRNRVYPDLLVMGSGLWHMLHFVNASDYGVSLEILRSSVTSLLPVSSEFGNDESVAVRSPHLFWLGMPTLVNSMLNTKEKKEKMTDLVRAKLNHHHLHLRGCTDNPTTNPKLGLLFPFTLTFMGNISSGGANPRRRHSGASRRSHPPPPPPVTPQPEIAANPFVYHGAAPYPNPPLHYPQYHYPGYYPPGPPMPHQHHHQQHQQHQHPHQQHQHQHPLHMNPAWIPGRYPCGPMMPNPAPFVEHQKAVTIRNDVNIRKETLRLEPDEGNSSHFLISFSFDATVSGSVTIYFFAKEGEDCILTPMKENSPAPVTVNFEQGLGQKFRQPSGTGIDFSVFEESELLKVGDMDVYPLAVKADASPSNHDESDRTPTSGNSTNSQITQAVFEKEKGEFRLKVIKQILWVNGMRYELQEIYGIGNSTEADVDESDQGKECVICLSEPRDTIVHPCRHMCMCSGCAKVLRFQTNRCPICRQPVERLLEIKVGG